MDAKVSCSLGGGLTGQIHDPKDITREGHPKHALPAPIRLCRDSRQEECPYALSVQVSAERFAFQDTLCFYALGED